MKKVAFLEGMDSWLVAFKQFCILEKSDCTQRLDD